MTIETPVGKLKRLLIEKLTDVMENGVTAITKQGEVVTLAPDAAMMNATLNAVKTFHAEAGETTQGIPAAVESMFARYQERKGNAARADA